MKSLRTGGSLLLGLLLVSTVICYLPGLGGPFLFDDYPNLVNNDWLKAEHRTPVDFRSGALSSKSSVLARPVTMATFTAQAWALDGISAPHAKIINLCLHLLLAALLYQILQLLVRAPHWRGSANARRWLPILGTAIWCLNPLLLSTVLYPVQRMAQLSTLAVVTGILVYVRYRSYWVREPLDGDRALACVLWLGLCLAIGVLSKENAVLLPALLLIVEVSFFRGHLAGRYERSWAISTWVFAATVVLAFALGLAYLADLTSSGYAYREFTLQERVLTQARVLWQYVYWFAVPDLTALGLYHDDLQTSTGLLAPATTGIAVAAWLAALIAAFAAHRAMPELFFAVLFFLVAHVLESSVLALEMVFEHRNYLPSIGLAVVVASVLLRAIEWGKRDLSRSAMALPALYVLCCAGVLALRAQYWSTELELSRMSLAHHPGSERSGFAYANALLRDSGALDANSSSQGQNLALARHEFEVLLQKNPASIPALVMLYVMDSQLYSDRSPPDQWLDSLETSIGHSTLSASDFAALNSLVDCAASGGCRISDDRLRRLLERFAEGFRYPHAVGRLAIDMLQDAEFSPEERLRQTQALVDEYPFHTPLQFELLKTAISANDFRVADLAILSIIANDRRRSHLPITSEYFAARSAVP